MIDGEWRVVAPPTAAMFWILGDGYRQINVFICKCHVVNGDLTRPSVTEQFIHQGECDETRRVCGHRLSLSQIPHSGDTCAMVTPRPLLNLAADLGRCRRRRHKENGATGHLVTHPQPNEWRNLVMSGVVMAV